MKIIMLTIALSCLIGCANTKRDYVFDGSSAASTEQSIHHVMLRLSAKHKEELMTALLAIQMSEIRNLNDLLTNSLMASGLDYEYLGKKIDGLNYDAVIALAKQSPAIIKQDEIKPSR